MELFSIRDEGSLAQLEGWCVYEKSKLNKQHLHGTIPYILVSIKFFISFYLRAPYQTLTKKTL